MGKLKRWLGFQTHNNRNFGWFYHPIFGRKSHGGWFYFHPLHLWATIQWWYRFGLHEEDALAGRCMGIGQWRSTPKSDSAEGK